MAVCWGCSVRYHWFCLLYDTYSHYSTYIRSDKILPLLEQGIVLVDLPGESDSNNLRVRIAQKAQERCDASIIVSNITRVLDDATAKEQLRASYRDKGTRRTILVPTHSEVCHLFIWWFATNRDYLGRRRGLWKRYEEALWCSCQVCTEIARSPEKAPIEACGTSRANRGPRGQKWEETREEEEGVVGSEVSIHFIDAKAHWCS